MAHDRYHIVRMAEEAFVVIGGSDNLIRAEQWVDNLNKTTGEYHLIFDMEEHRFVKTNSASA
jgi:hypothetical protein